METTITEAQAVEKSKELVEREWNRYGDEKPYTLRYESVRLHEGTYQVRFLKEFREPTKENPPYRLVLVRSDGSVEWGMP